MVHVKRTRFGAKIAFPRVIFCLVYTCHKNIRFQLNFMNEYRLWRYTWKNDFFFLHLMICFLVNEAYASGGRIEFPRLKGFVTLNYNSKTKLKRTLDIPWNRHGHSFVDRGVNEPDAHGPNQATFVVHASPKLVPPSIVPCLWLCDSSVNERHGPRSKTRRDTPRTHFRSPSPSHTIFRNEASHVALSRSRSYSPPKSAWWLGYFYGIFASDPPKPRPQNSLQSQCSVSRVQRTAVPKRPLQIRNEARSGDGRSDLAALLQETTAWVRHGGG
jgi:hypothetical protein